MRTSDRMIAPAAVLAAALFAMSVPQYTASAGDLVVMSPGETPMQALRSAPSHDIAASLRASWRASGRGSAQTSLPAITSGTVTTDTITIGDPAGYPALTFGFRTDTPGLNSAIFEFASPDGREIYTALYVQGPYATKGTASFASTSLMPATLGLYSPPGTWTLQSATLYDWAGNSTTYSAAQLAQLFTKPSFNVVNKGQVDDTPPKILRGRILTQTVSRSAAFPLFKSTITATDAVSGLYQALVFISPPGSGGSSIAQQSPMTTPKHTAVVDANTLLSSSYPVGVWKILAYSVCDFAGNCTGSGEKSDVLALFGTNTFTVTP